MTNEEAIKFIKEQMIFPRVSIEWETYHNDACFMATEALEKQISKKPILGGCYPNIKEWECPNCKSYFAKLDDRPNYCCECGQKIDWNN